MEPEGIHPETLEEKPPLIIANLYTNAVDFVAGHGWYILILAAVCAILWTKLGPYLKRWQEQRERDNEAALHHKNPELFRTRQLAIQVARQRMQAQHEAQAALAAEQAKEREEQRRQERLARLGGTSGHRLNASSTDGQAKTTSSKTDFNPLMGAGSSGGYRPPPRSCPGGGCGK